MLGGWCRTSGGEACISCQPHSPIKLTRITWTCVALQRSYMRASNQQWRNISVRAGADPSPHE
jgi:hypothetical protein